MKMKAIWIFMITFFVYKHKVVISSPCEKDYYVIKKNGLTSCLHCNNCPDGQGLYPPCGSELDHPPDSIECLPCKPGKTFSDEHDPSSCKSCHICSSNEIVIKNCTEYSDTVCGKCQVGYYFENNTHGCLQCSYCCGDESDVKIPACKSMGQKQCSYLNSPKCTPAPPSTTKPTTITIATSTIATTEKNSVESKNLSTKNIMAVAIGVISAVLITLFICYCYRRHKNKKRIPKNNQAHNGDVEHGGHPLLSQCSLSEVQFDLRIQNYNGPETRIKKVLEENQLLLELFCDNENDNCVKKYALEFDWEKDGSPKNDEEQRQLQVNNLRVSDSGIYKCHVQCSKHKQGKYCEMVVHVLPKPGWVYKCLRDISHGTMQRIAVLLDGKTAGIGNWRNVGDHYGMDSAILKSLEDKDDKSMTVLEFIPTKHPKLTVFDFCEFLKTQQQMKLVMELENELTVELKEEKSSEEELRSESLNDTRDSGIDFQDHCILTDAIPNNTSSDNTENLSSLEQSPNSRPGTVPGHEIRSTSFDDQCNLQVAIPNNTGSYNTRKTSPENRKDLLEQSPDSKLTTVPHPVMKCMRNAGYSDSSREGSVDELDLLTFPLKTKSTSDNSQDGKKKRKFSFNRQVSKDSQKSAGSVSLQSVKNALKVKWTKTQNANYLEHEDTDDSEV